MEVKQVDYRMSICAFAGVEGEDYFSKGLLESSSSSKELTLYKIFTKNQVMCWER